MTELHRYDWFALFLRYTHHVQHMHIPIFFPPSVTTPSPSSSFPTSSSSFPIYSFILLLVYKLSHHHHHPHHSHQQHFCLTLHIICSLHPFLHQSLLYPHKSSLPHPPHKHPPPLIHHHPPPSYLQHHPPPHLHHPPPPPYLHHLPPPL